MTAEAATLVRLELYAYQPAQEQMDFIIRKFSPTRRMKMKRTLLLLSLCTLFASTVFAQKNRPPACPPDITNLQVVFADRADDLFKSDNGTPYVSSKSKGENIEIRFQKGNCSYDFTMNLNSSKRTTKLTLGGTTLDSEFFNFDRIASVPVTQDTGNTSFLSSPFCQNGWAIDPNTGGASYNADGSVRDNYGGCGIDSEGRYYVLRSVGIQAGSVDYGFRYQFSPFGGGIATWAAGTSFIRVYHPSPFVWELVPDLDTYSMGRYYDKSANMSLGDYSVPFKITVTQIN
jgi:hypothetical protein